MEEYFAGDESELRDRILSHKPTKLESDQVWYLPSRDKLLDEPICRAVGSVIAQQKPLLFMSTSVYESSKFAGSWGYFPHLFGVLPCGSSTCVVLTGCPVYVDIGVPIDYALSPTYVFTIGLPKHLHVPDQRQIDAFKSFVSEYVRAGKPGKTEVVHMYPASDFCPHQLPFIRLHFKSLWDRRNALANITKLSSERTKIGLPALTLSSNDKTNYYAKIARDHIINLAGWNILSKYEWCNSEKYDDICAKYVFAVDIADIRHLSEEQSAGYPERTRHLLARDKTLVLGWDIETYSAIGPMGSDSVIFMMCGVLSYPWQKEPVATIAVVNGDCDVHEKVDIVIICKTELDMLETWSRVLMIFRPDIMATYNGSHFDWPMYIHKLRSYGILEREYISWCRVPRDNLTDSQILKYEMSSIEFKIDASTNHTLDMVARIPGILDTDAMPICAKMFPSAEVTKQKSLAYYLERLALPPKVDMPYTRMFNIYLRNQALRRIGRCHCGNPISGVCACDTVPDLDLVPGEYEGVYTNEYIPEIRDAVLAGKCCWCAKRAQNHADMAIVSHYCVVDSESPQLIYGVRAIIAGRRALANMSGVSLFETFFYADGKKVCNSIAKECHARGFAFAIDASDRQNVTRSFYPGAWVFPPLFGLYSDTAMHGYTAEPITGLDFSSLYPSLMMQENKSPDQAVRTPEYAEYLKSRGYGLHRIEFEYKSGGKNKHDPANTVHSISGWTVRHNNITVAGEPKITTHYRKRVTAGDTIERELLNILPNLDLDLESAPDRKVQYLPVHGRDALPGECMGIFPTVLKRLFDARVAIKKRLSPIQEAIELLHKEKKPVPLSLRLEHDRLNAEQLAIKILSNTFYGQTGFWKSSAYDLLIAGSVTTAGQYYIKAVASYVRQRGFVIHYGDTDSLYLSCPRKIYAGAYAKYFADIVVAAGTNVDKNVEILRAASAIDLSMIDNNALMALVKTAVLVADSLPQRENLRLACWDSKVKLTQLEIAKLAESVYDYLISIGCALYLKMAYEEVGYPFVLVGKKKYALVKHEKVVNFYPSFKQLMIRGIEIVKQGQSRIAKRVCEAFLTECLSINFRGTLLTLAKDICLRFLAGGFDSVIDGKIVINVDDYVLYKKYRADKKNQAVHAFVARMKHLTEVTTNDVLKQLYEPPVSGDKFCYIITVQREKFCLDGRTIPRKVGNCMEYKRVYEYALNNTPIEIDRGHYLAAIIGLLARFIVPHFQLKCILQSGITRTGLEQDVVANGDSYELSEDISTPTRGTVSDVAMRAIMKITGGKPSRLVSDDSDDDDILETTDGTWDDGRDDEDNSDDRDGDGDRHADNPDALDEDDACALLGIMDKHMVKRAKRYLVKFCKEHAGDIDTTKALKKKYRTQFTIMSKDLGATIITELKMAQHMGLFASESVEIYKLIMNNVVISKLIDEHDVVAAAKNYNRGRKAPAQSTIAYMTKLYQAQVLAVGRPGVEITPVGLARGVLSKAVRDRADHELLIRDRRQAIEAEIEKIGLAMIVDTMDHREDIIRWVKRAHECISLGESVPAHEFPIPLECIRRLANSIFELSALTDQTRKFDAVIVSANISITVALVRNGK